MFLTVRFCHTGVFASCLQSKNDGPLDVSAHMHKQLDFQHAFQVRLPLFENKRVLKKQENACITSLASGANRMCHHMLWYQDGTFALNILSSF